MEDREPMKVDGVVPTIYLTKEQIWRLAALSLDSLVGVQIHTDASDQSYMYCEQVTIDDPNEMECATIYTDGSWRRTT